MEKSLIFIFDGKCPFCNKFAELLELKSNIPSIQIKDARDNSTQIPEGYDMDVKGALLINGSEYLSGAEAINFICSKIKSPSDPLLSILRNIFNSKERSSFIFPFLLIARRLTLYLRNVPRKLPKH